MSEIDDGGTAFPVEGGPNSQLISQYGLSKREWYAGMALHGILQLHGSVVGGPERTAKMSYEVADAMIRAGEVGK